MSDYDRVAALHDEPYVLPWELNEKAIRLIILVSLCLSCLYSFFLFVVCPTLNLSTADPKKVSYQMTNFCINGALGVVGLYYFVRLPKDPEIEDQIVGLDSLYPLGSIQIGCQIWAIPVGFFLAKEAPEMILHHFAVILVASMSTFLRLAYKYYTPFMYGILELSSLPLAIMNMWKQQPKWIERSPTLYTLIRLTFCFCFLFIRWWMYLPRKYLFLRLLALTIATSESWPLRIYYSVVAIGSFFLACLQILWGSLIIKSLAKVVGGAIFGDKKDKKKTV